MENIIEIKHLNKSFGEVKAVRDLSFCVKEGELFAFLGINGAGKSTTINIMCGQLSKDSGKIVIDGSDLDQNVDAVKRELGVVFQNSVLDKALSVRENLESRAALYGITGEAFKMRLKELARLLDFEDILKRTVGKLSGGQRRRIDIARALLHRPKILILDEPTRGVDVGAKAEIYEIMNELTKQGVSIIMISSELPEIINMSDRVYVMYDGRLTGCISYDEDLSQEAIMKLATQESAGGKTV